ncbi:hypothetical protein EYF80_013652 [Liparis tanakae]|uniref:Uncharacterized protein n=1 Tax=Liparis tanakae TaxID=230148 RepID=A0A4Z2IED0_9TELE|nr:hypothetical protein EYF80_013652 [Liparis tanakae]
MAELWLPAEMQHKREDRPSSGTAPLALLEESLDSSLYEHVYRCGKSHFCLTALSQTKKMTFKSSIDNATTRVPLSKVHNLNSPAKQFSGQQPMGPQQIVSGKMGRKNHIVPAAWLHIRDLLRGSLESGVQQHKDQGYSGAASLPSADRKGLMRRATHRLHCRGQPAWVCKQKLCATVENSGDFHTDEFKRLLKVLPQVLLVAVRGGQALVDEASRVVVEERQVGGHVEDVADVEALQQVDVLSVVLVPQIEEGQDWCHLRVLDVRRGGQGVRVSRNKRIAMNHDYEMLQVSIIYKPTLVLPLRMMGSLPSLLSDSRTTCSGWENVSRLGSMVLSS